MTSQVTPQNSLSWVPNTPGKVACISFALLLIAAAALTTAVFVQRDPGLNSIFLPVYGVVAGMGILILLSAILSACKSKKETASLETKTQ